MVRRLGLALAGILVAAVAVEILLRLVPFERLKYEAFYGHFSGNVVGRFLEYDPVLTFRNRRGARFPDLGVEINRLGLRGPEVRAARQPGVTRILCLGDSCTFGGALPYPEILQSILDRRFGRRRFEVLNAGVIGYTSLHGLEWFRRELHALDPDVVTIYFGWNDLWREQDSAIGDLFRRTVRGERAAFRSALWDALERSLRFARNRSGAADAPIQIPLDRYREILEQFAAAGEAQGFTPVLVTAPSALDGGAPPRWLVENGFVGPDDDLLAIRRSYNRVVSDVARRRGLPLADAAAEFERSDVRSLFERPDEDPVHPSARGYRKIAEVIAEAVGERPSVDRPHEKVEVTRSGLQAPADRGDVSPAGP